MFNLTVAEARTFFVGDGAWLVHNASQRAICDVRYNLVIGPGNNYQELLNISKQYGRVVALEPDSSAFHEMTTNFVRQMDGKLEMIQAFAQNPHALATSAIALGGNVKASRLISIYPQPGSRGTTRGIAGGIQHHLGSGNSFYVTAEHSGHFQEIVNAITPYVNFHAANGRVITDVDFISGNNFLGVPFPRSGSVKIHLSEMGMNINWPFSGHSSPRVWEIMGIRK